MEVREGDAKYAGMMKMWLAQKKPHRIDIGGISFEAIQDANDKKWYFVSSSEAPKGFYESRSWGG